MAVFLRGTREWYSAYLPLEGRGRRG